MYISLGIRESILKWINDGVSPKYLIYQIWLWGIKRNFRRF